jgi:hypothetical protein
VSREGTGAAVVGYVLGSPSPSWESSLRASRPRYRGRAGSGWLRARDKVGRSGRTGSWGGRGGAVRTLYGDPLVRPAGRVLGVLTEERIGEDRGKAFCLFGSGGGPWARFAWDTLRRRGDLRAQWHLDRVPRHHVGGLGYYFSLTGGDELGQTLGIAAAALNAVCMGVSGLEHPFQ